MQTEVLELICVTLREQAAGNPKLALEELGPDTRLLGAQAVVDSMGLVALIVDLEEKIAANYGREIVLADERAMSLRTSPFKRVQTLVEHIVEKLGART